MFGTRTQFVARALVYASLENARQVCQVQLLIESQNQMQRFLIHALNLTRALCGAIID